MRCLFAEILKVYQILTYKILHVGTNLIHNCSLKSSLIFIIRILHLFFFFFFFFFLCAWYTQRPTTHGNMQCSRHFSPSRQPWLYSNAPWWYISRTHGYHCPHHLQKYITTNAKDKPIFMSNMRKHCTVWWKVLCYFIANLSQISAPMVSSSTHMIPALPKKWLPVNRWPFVGT